MPGKDAASPNSKFKKEISWLCSLILTAAWLQSLWLDLLVRHDSKLLCYHLLVPPLGMLSGFMTWFGHPHFIPTWFR